jgi:Protein of unknown function, DUF547
MTKHIGTTILFFCGFLTLYQVANAIEPVVPEPFQGFDDTSKYTINYDDLTGLLGTVVVDVGRSRRVLAQPAPDITGTRMKAKVKRLTDGEGNRFFYETFTDNEEGRQFLHHIQVSLEQLPTEMPLENFSRDEQLAYWLNLYNVTVVNEIIAVYPKRNLKKLFWGKKSVFSRKLLTVAGVPLSLNDIQFIILEQNYDDDPLIMYGLYQGIVGGPNIRTSAYTGDDVYRALEENADEFINSNRGTFCRHDNAFRVSSMYDRNRVYFPDFDSDLSKHLLQFLEGKERVALQATSTIKPNINDWTVTDLGVSRHEIGGSFARNNAALLDSFRGDNRTAFGGVQTATLKVIRKKKDPEEDDVKLEDLERFPVEGARVEEVTVENTQPAD